MYDLYVNNQWGLKHEKQSFEYQGPWSMMVISAPDCGLNSRLFFTVPLGRLGFDLRRVLWDLSPISWGESTSFVANPAMVNHDGKMSRPVDRFQHPEMGIRP